MFRRMQTTAFSAHDPVGWHGTTILCVRRGGTVVMAGDGQVSLGQTVIKGNARKVRRIGAGGTVLAGFAGATADAFTLLERLEAKLERFPSQLERACVELAKDWRTDRYLRRLEAMMAVADAERSFTLTGNGDVLEPDDGVIGIGGSVLAGFAGATADAFTLLERLEAKLERFPSQLERACVELAKDWRTDRYLRRLEAMMAVADKDRSFTLTGNGDVLEPEDGVIAIGSGGNYALAAARALMSVDGLSSEEIARRAMKIAAEICVYTNNNVIIETL